MSLRLILIRHAKSNWDDPFADDHARVLNARGRRAARAVGRWMDARGYLPDLVLSSDSARTRETADRLMAEWTRPARVRFLPRLYHADPDTLLEVLQDAQGDTVALIAHNPGIGAFASTMVAQRPEHARFADYPTCATTLIDFDTAHWADIRPGAGRVVAFVTPHDLSD
ncbi:MAG: phosphohistidine phosphatase SixA [Rhodobacteraceae bacterium HLUCCA08]|nr:MAG: phosphohistidine phosphatase SixA [Rhodobacteraceae bacterium HLUCCA08]